MDTNSDSDILRISYSQAQTWQRCRYAWHLSYQQKWRSKEQKRYLVIGSIGHKLLEAYYRSNKDYSVVQEYVKDLLSEEHLKDYPDGSFLQSVSHAAWLVTRYVRDIAPDAERGWNTIGVEQRFVVTLKTPKGRLYELEGIIDRIDESPTGDLWFLDYKFSDRQWSDIQIGLDPQMSTYTAGLTYSDRIPVGFKIVQLGTYDYKDKTKETHEYPNLVRTTLAYRTQIENQNFLYEFGCLVDEIYEQRNNIRRSLRWDCSRCQFSEVCLYAMKGLDPEDLLESSFTRSERKDDELLVPTSIGEIEFSS